MWTHNPGEAALARKGLWVRKRAAGDAGPSARAFDAAHASFSPNPEGAGRKTVDPGVESSSHGPTMPRHIRLKLDGFRHGAARPDHEATS